jgi:3-oxoacyl-[acyl-carrier-protein] synthase II
MSRDVEEVVITGLGIVSPIGIGKEPFWDSLVNGRSGVRPVTLFNTRDLPIRFAGEVTDFDAKKYVQPRKNLKVMARDTQLGVAAADMAVIDSGLTNSGVDRDRFGVVFGTDLMLCQADDVAMAFAKCQSDGRFDFGRWADAAQGEIFPLWMLKYLPNMPACHIAIAQDARGPNNSITLGEVSSLLAVAEAVRVIERGLADVMITGGTGSRVNPTVWGRLGLGQSSRRNESPAEACRPFDADREGQVYGEGSAAFILESRQHAEARDARILGRILGYASTFEPRRDGKPFGGTGIARAITKVVKSTGVRSEEVGHINAHGLSTTVDDQAEAQAIHQTLKDVPVTAPKSFFGNLGSGTGAVELAASLMALEKRLVPVSLNYRRRDSQCPVNVVRDQPLVCERPLALALNQAPLGQSVALLLAKR